MIIIKGKINPLRIFLAMQILGAGIGIAISKYQEATNKCEKPKLTVTEIAYKDSKFNPQEIINGYDLDNNGSIDKIVKKEAYEAGHFGKLYKAFEYSPDDREFSKLNKILEDKRIK